MDYQAMLSCFQQKHDENRFFVGTRTGFYQDGAWQSPVWAEYHCHSDDDTQYHEMVIQPNRELVNLLDRSELYSASDGSVIVSQLDGHPELGRAVDAASGEVYAGEMEDGVPHGMGTVFFCGNKTDEVKHTGAYPYQMYLDGIWQNGTLQYIRVGDQLIFPQSPDADSDTILAAARLCADAAHFTETPERAAVYLALARELTAHTDGIAGEMERCWTIFCDSSAPEATRLAAAEQYVKACDADGAEPDKERLAEMLELLDAHDSARWHTQYINALLDTYTMHYSSYDATDHPDYSGYSRWYEWGFTRCGRLYGFIFQQHVYNDNPYNDDDVTDSAGLTADGERIVCGLSDNGKLFGEPLPPELLVERDEQGRIIYCGQHKNGIRHGLGVTIQYGAEKHWIRGFWQNGACVHVFVNRKIY